MRTFLLLATLSLTACGFHLRGAGSSNLPYQSMYISLPDTAEVNIWLQRYIKASGSTTSVGHSHTLRRSRRNAASFSSSTGVSANARGLHRAASRS